MSYFSRRKFLGKTGALLSAMVAAGFITSSAMAADYPTAEVNTTGLAVTDDTVTVGILHSLTGTMAISESTLKDTVLMMNEEQNKKGGVRG